VRFPEQPNRASRWLLQSATDRVSPGRRADALSNGEISGLAAIEGEILPIAQSIEG
jgi:hypothetical protein